MRVSPRFGGGGILCSLAGSKLLAHFATMQTYLGPSSQVQTVTQQGRLFVEQAGGNLQEVVVAATKNLYMLPEGVYAIGAGSTGLLGAGAIRAIVSVLPPRGPNHYHCGTL